MLQRSTQISGITIVHSVQNSDSGVASLRFPSHPRVFAYEAKGSSESLRCLSLRLAHYPFATRVAPSLLFGELRPSLIALRSEFFGRTLFSGRFAASLLAAECLRC